MAKKSKRSSSEEHAHRVSQGLCVRCGKNQRDPSSKSRCRDCMDYAKKNQAQRREKETS